MTDQSHVDLEFDAFIRRTVLAPRYFRSSSGRRCLDLDRSAISAASERRFWKKVRRSAGCWIWTGATNGQGYGVLKIGGRHLKPHRVVLVLSGVELDTRLTVDHVCRNRLCVRPDHLEQVELVENQRRGRAAAAAIKPLAKVQP